MYCQSLYGALAKGATARDQRITVTRMYNVVEKLRTDTALTLNERAVHEINSADYVFDRAAGSDDGKWRFESFVTACRTFSSIEPVISPPWTWARGMFMYDAAIAVAIVS